MMTDPITTDGGVAAIRGGSNLLVGHLLNLGGDPVTGTTPGKAAVFVGHTVLVFASVTLVARQHEAQPRLASRVGGLLTVVFVSAVPRRAGLVSVVGAALTAAGFAQAGVTLVEETPESLEES